MPCAGATRLVEDTRVVTPECSYRIQIEYLVVAFDEECRKVRLSLRQADILKALAEDEALSKQGGCVPDLQVIKQ
jgi:hypothetical protein